MSGRGNHRNNRSNTNTRSRNTTNTTTNRKDICGSKFGTSFEASRWLSLDVCGTFGVTFSLGIHIFAFVVIVMHLLSGSLLATGVFLLLYTPSVFMALWALCMAYTTDPGAVPMGARPLVTVKRAQSNVSTDSGNGNGNNSNNSNNNGDNPTTTQPQPQRPRALRRCPKCGDNYKPNRAHHDSVTGRCIVKFDHFCPWVGNAIGALNHKFFVLFVGYTLASCIFSLILIGMRAIHCGLPSRDVVKSSTSTENDVNNNNEDQNIHAEECRGWDESYLGLVLLIVSVVFGIFTSCMLFEQIDAIKTNQSKIARMKMRVGNTGTELSRVTEEFNEMFGGTTNRVEFHWFIPHKVEFPRGMEKVVLGYEWDMSFDAIPYQEPSHNNSSGSVDIELGNGGLGGGGGRRLDDNDNGGGRIQVELQQLSSLQADAGSGSSSRPPSRPPSRTASSSSKDKHSDHDIGSNGGASRSGTAAISATSTDRFVDDDIDVDDDDVVGMPVPAPSSPSTGGGNRSMNTKSTAKSRMVSRRNSRGKLT